MVFRVADDNMGVGAKLQVEAAAKRFWQNINAIADILGQELGLKSFRGADAVIEFGANLAACVRELQSLRCVEGEAEEDDGLFLELLPDPVLGSLDDGGAFSKLLATDVPSIALRREDHLHSVHLDDAGLRGFEEIPHAQLPELR